MASKIRAANDKDIDKIIDVDATLITNSKEIKRMAQAIQDLTDVIQNLCYQVLNQQESDSDVYDSEYTSSLNKLKQNCIDFKRLGNTFQGVQGEEETMDESGEERRRVKRRSLLRSSGGEPEAKRVVVTDRRSGGAGNPPPSYDSNRSSRRNSDSRLKDQHKPDT